MQLYKLLKMRNYVQTAVDSLTGKNSGDNLGEGVPVIKFEQWENDYIEVKLILKRWGL